MEGLRAIDTDMVVYVHPSKAKNVSDAVLCELGSLLFKFNDVFDGVVLAYDAHLLTDQAARILPGMHPYFGVKLPTKFLLFSPKPNMLVEGKVVKVCEESIHVIVLGFSSAIITEEDIREEFRFKIKHGEKVFSSKAHRRHIIKIGTIIRFLVKSFDEEILHFSGSLVPDHTGSVKWLAKNVMNDSQIDRSIREHGKKDRRDEMEQDVVVAHGDTHPFSKNSKRRRIDEKS